MLLIFISCTSTSEETKVKNDNLLGFKTRFISEFGDENYDKLEDEVDNKKIEIKYINDIIYVTYLDELNACGQYDGDIVLLNDTVMLEVNLISDEVCTSTSIEKITFIIDNPNEEEKIILRSK